MKMTKKILILVLVNALFFSCATYLLEKKLDPDSRDFLSKVRYLITRQEKKIFLNLPPSERENFIQQFWKKRDPDPSTEENEFKESYFQRIEDANQLFKQGSTPGWLQDRGRIYVTLGPPTNRETYPRGTSFYGAPVEIWYYGFFPVVFIDTNWTGNYRLEPLSAQHINEINKAQIDYLPKVSQRKIVFDFDFSMKKSLNGKALFQFKIPYKNIWLSEKDKKLQTTLETTLEVLDEQENRVWTGQKKYNISIHETDFIQFIGKNYLIEIEAEIKPGTYLLIVEMENKTGGERIRKEIKFSFKPDILEE